MKQSLIRVLGILFLVAACTSPRDAGETTESPAPPKTIESPSPPKTIDSPADSTQATTARQAVDIFFNSRREGNLAGVQSVVPPGTPYKMSGPVAIDSYTIQSTRMLDAEQAALESKGGPKREAGDEIIDVLEQYPEGRSRVISYYVREYDGAWKIYGWGFQLDTGVSQHPPGP